MFKTGVFATPEELTDLKQLAARGWRAGDVMMVSTVMEGITRDRATVEAQIACHKVALSHGLPEITGYYGLTSEGEFVRI